MDEKKDAAAGQQCAPDHTPPPIPPTIKAAPDQPAPDPKQPEKSDKISKSDWVMIVLTVFIALGTIASAGAIILQWREMVNGGADTTAIAAASKVQACAAKQIAEASRRNATAAEGFATSANGINTKLDEAVGKLNDQAGATRALARQAVVQSQAANETAAGTTNEVLASKEQTRLSMRPYVGLDDDAANPLETSALQIEEKGKATIGYRIHLKNYSSSPAQNVFAYAELIVADDLRDVEEGQKIACRDAVIGKPDIGVVIFQGRIRELQTSAGVAQVDIRNGKGSLVFAWLAGCIGFRDQFGFLYRTRFRARMNPDQGYPRAWIAPLTLPMTATGKFEIEAGGIDSGNEPKYK